MQNNQSRRAKRAKTLIYRIKIAESRTKIMIRTIKHQGYLRKSLKQKTSLTAQQQKKNWDVAKQKSLKKSQVDP